MCKVSLIVKVLLLGLVVKWVVRLDRRKEVYLNNSRRHTYAFIVHTTCNAGSSGLHHELHVCVVEEALPRSTRWTREGHPTLKSRVGSLGSGVEEGSKQARL
jgi:hypothetical protein